MYQKIIQLVEYMDIYIDILAVYQELLLMQTPVKGTHIREAVIKHSRGVKNRCPSCGVDKGENCTTYGDCDGCDLQTKSHN